MFFKFILSATLLLISVFEFSKADCTVQIDNHMTGTDYYDNWPLVLHPTILQFYTLGPNPGQISVAQNENLRLACPGRNNRFVNLFPPTNITTVQCIGNQQFLYETHNFNFYEYFSCLLVSIKS